MLVGGAGKKQGAPAACGHCVAHNPLASAAAAVPYEVAWAAVHDHNAVEGVGSRTVDVAAGGSPVADIHAGEPAGDIAAAGVGTAAVEDRVPRCDT